MKTLLQIFFFSLLCYACSSEQQPKDFIEIDMVPLIESEAKEMPLQEWAKGVRIIPLDAHAEVSFKLIKNVFKRNDTLLVYSSHRLSVFNMSGKYLYDIGSERSGTFGRKNVRSVHLYNDLIYVLVDWTTIEVYDWAGKFVKKRGLPSNVWDIFIVSGKEEVLAYVANRSGEEPVRFYRMKGEELLDTVFNPFIYKLPENVPQILAYEHEIQSSAGSLVVFKEMDCDTVYRVDEHLQTSPYIVFNMGKHHYTREQRYSETMEEWVDRKMEGNECYMKVTGQVNDKIYIFNNREQSMIREVLYVGDTYCYDKITKETSKYFLTYEENDWGILPDASFVPKTILDDKYLVDWESSGNEENAVLVLVEP